MKKHFNRAVRLFLAWAEKEEKQNIWKLNCVCHTASCQLCQPREPLNPQSSSQFERCTSKGQHAGRSWREVRGASQQRHLLYWERLTALQQQRERDGAHSSEAKEKNRNRGTKPHRNKQKQSQTKPVSGNHSLMTDMRGDFFFLPRNTFGEDQSSTSLPLLVSGESVLFTAQSRAVFTFTTKQSCTFNYLPSLF